MCEREIIALGSADVQEILDGREADVIAVVRNAYRSHGQGASALPHSTFLRFPEDASSRIIALPAYLGGEVGVAGVKWISSFPANLEHGIDRASAVLILNSTVTGRPTALLEASLISARRTAASAALAASVLQTRDSSTLGLIGCGPIGFEIVRFVRVACPAIKELLICDLSASRAEEFKSMCQGAFPGLKVKIAESKDEVFRSTTLVAFATTAGTPHVDDLSVCRPGALVLHISLRDLAAKVILASDNIVDDVDHVCRAQTSIHLAEQQVGNRNFVRCTLADVLDGRAAPRRDPQEILVFSPFGLGVLDIAVGQFILQNALQQNKGMAIPEFLPRSWNQVPDAVRA